ncbi:MULTISPECIES: hypothetical protein [Acidovorax]|uniref:Uncharacterized protein n=1 Tax=Acidovorax facilis TaxID=12917 RepID=A0ABV8DAP9_9BURK|nr:MULTISPECIES: hypothetical protein [Acidovorax]MBO1007109.1 hypothetical protein [Acidovorax sp. SD340]MCO4240872.1 hypothetical protein [Acidovorax facilis]
MKFFEWVFCAAVAVALVAVLWLAINRDGCEDHGGRLVFTHYAINTIMVGKVLMPISTPQYRCDGARP